MDVLVAGGPTHAHSLSTEASRKEAAAWAHDPDKNFELDDEELTSGLRDLIASMHTVPARFAAFDTRSDVPRLLSGAASVRISKELRKRGSLPVVPPESFLVTKFAGLKSGEAERGTEWGDQVARAAAAQIER